MQLTAQKKLFFYIVLLIFCIGFASVRAIPDNDLWARLIAGGHIVENLSIIKNDFLSYTPTHIWYDHEWGASVVFYGVLKYFGETGLVILRGLLLFLTLFFCILTVKENKDEGISPYNPIYWVVVFFAGISSTGPVVRCLLFTSLFFALTIYILERAKKGKNKSLYFLPLLIIFWSNIHGGCLSLLGILAIYTAGEFLNGKEYKKYIITALICLAVMFINPYGKEYVKFLFEAGTMDRGYITEWLSPFIGKYTYMYVTYKIYLVILTASTVIYLFLTKPKYKTLDKTKYMIIALMTILSVLKVRYISFYVFTAGTLLYNDFYYIINKITGKIKTKIGNSRYGKLNASKEIIIYTVLLSVSLPLLISNKKIEITSTKYPRFAVEFIKENGLTGNLFVNFEYGSYCAYKLYPKNKIVMDGRYEEVYNPDLLLDLKDFHLVKNDWDKIIREYPPDVMIIEKKYPVYKKLKEEGKYVPVFENNLSAVFVPKEKLKDEYIYPKIDDDYYNKSLFDTDIDFIKLKNKN